MKKPKASFVIPCYNAVDTLAETVNSCLNQSEPRIEIIVVDDGSTENMNYLYGHFCGMDERVRIEYIGRNVGRSAARNWGIASATSDVIFTLDSDDIALPHRVSDTLNYMKKNPTVDIVSTGFQIATGLGKIEGYIKAEQFDFNMVKRTGMTHIGHSTMAFKKSVFDKVKYTEGDYCKHGIDDWKFQVDAHKAGFKFGCIDKNLAIYRFVQKQRDEVAIKKLKDECLCA